MNSPRQIWILCGEPSGDRYAGYLASAMLRQNPDVQIHGVGGQCLFSEKVEPIAHIRSLSVGGWTTVIAKLPALWKIRKEIIRKIITAQPEAVVMIDFPDFHLSIAGAIHRACRRKPKPLLIYYIPPQFWIWRKKRIHQIRQCFDAVIPAFAFEKELYRLYGIPVFYAGHPIIDALQSENQGKISNPGNQSRHLLLLPGSRCHEIKYVLPLMLESVGIYTQRKNSSLSVIIAAVPDIPIKFYQQIIEKFRKKHQSLNLSIAIEGITTNTYSRADAALCKPGTNNLEAAFYGIPFAVIYRTHFLNWLIIRLAVKIPFASLVNLLSNKLVVREFLQSQASAENIAAEMDRLLNDPVYRSEIQAALQTFYHQNGLQATTAVAEKNATFILSLIDTKNSSS